MAQPSILKSHKRSKIIETHFYRLYSIMTGSKIIAGSPSNFEAVVSVLLQICGQICRGMPYPCIFVEEVVPLLGEITDKLVLTFVCGRNLNISNDLVKFSEKNESAKFFACELSVERVGTFGVVLYRNQ